MEKSWFTERIGQKVVRSFTYLDKTEETEFEVTEKNAGYLWLLTEKGYTFRDGAVIAHTATTDSEDWLEAARPVLRIHKTLQACVSCEG